MKSGRQNRTSFHLLGSFRVIAADGSDLTPRSRKAQALLALLANSPHLLRNRSWLASKLWSESDSKKASDSLRQALSEIRTSFAKGDADILRSDRNVVWLHEEVCWIDVKNLRDLKNVQECEFLEGLDIADEAFEEWLTFARATLLTEVEEIRKSDEFRKRNLKPKSGRKPVLAVMPFQNDSSQAIEPYVLDGLNHDLNMLLSRIPWMSVIAQSSTRKVSSATSEVETFSQILGADYSVCGQVGKSGDHLYLAVELYRTSSDEIIWFDKIGLGENVFESDLRNASIQIAGNLDSRINTKERFRAIENVVSSKEVTELIWRGRWHLYQFSKSDAVEAERCFSEAMELDRNNPEAAFNFAWCQLWQTWARRGNMEQIVAVRDLGVDTIKRHPEDGRGYWIAGTCEAWLRNFEGSDTYICQAIELYPSLTIAHGQRGSNAIFGDHPQDALEPLQTALRLSPHDALAFFYLGELAMAHYLTGKYDKAMRFADEAINRRPRYWYAHLVRVLSSHALGQEDLCAQHKASLFSAKPDFQKADIEWLPFRDRGLIAQFWSVVEFHEEGMRRNRHAEIRQ